jgi:aspartate/methionine/tyrosine aminotransferase
MPVRRTEYLAWAIRRYHDLRYDLASSGTPDVGARDLEIPDGTDDFGAWDDLAALAAGRIGCPAEEVVASSGATGAVTLVCATLLSPGDRVLVERPAYEPLVHIPAAFGAVVDRFDRRFEAGWALEPDVMARALRPGTKLAIVTEPNNPTGVLSPPEAIAAAADVARRAGAWLLVNEVYRGFYGPGSARRIAPGILVANSVTKYQGLGWARGGWLSGPADVMRTAADAQITLSVLAPSSAAWGIAALRNESLRDRALGFASPRKRAVVARWVRAHPRLSWVEPGAGLFGLVRVADPPDLLALAERLLREHGLLFAPGSFFEAPGTMRISWGAPEERLAEGLEILGRALGG